MDRLHLREFVDARLALLPSGSLEWSRQRLERALAFLTLGMRSMITQSLHTNGRPELFPPSRASILSHGDARSTPGLPRESRWRESVRAARGLEYLEIVASRWIDGRTYSRREESESPPDRHVISIAMRSTHLKLGRGSRTLFEGMMPAGTIHVSGPSQGLVAEFHAPCDFLHLYPTNEFIRRRHGATDPFDAACDLNDLMMRDPVAERLARSLIEQEEFDDDRYAHSVGQTIVMRLLIQCRSRQGASEAKVSPLPKWRLKRVQDHLDRHAHEPMRLADLAAVAGLSRMHFAAQFRAATGHRPHEYLLLRRIERAKELLSKDDMPIVEVALSVGFQGQAHFSTVFRRLTGETPARWRRAAEEMSNPFSGSKSLAGAAGPTLHQPT